jgi:beta-xylosidase
LSKLSAADAPAPAADASTTTAAAPAAASTPPAATGGRRGGGRRGGGGPPRAGQHLLDIGLHDPWILAEASNKTYYMYVPGRGGMAYYKSKDLLTWDGAYPCFTIPNDCWANPSEGLWAPEVHFWKGKYHMFGTLHNSNVSVPPGGSFAGYTRHLRSTTIAVSDTPEGPFTLVKKDNPIAPHDFMTIDGTFYVDPAGKPWMVYAHEWVQKIDGTIEALPLNDDLTDAVGDPIYLFKASDAPWIDSTRSPSTMENRYVTDGPELWRTKDNHLLMLWSSYKRSPEGYDVYVETVARSKTGDLKGPWEQLPILVENDSGHGMLFKTFEGQLMLFIQQPFNGAHAKDYEIEDLGDSLRITKFRDDISGPPLGPQPGQWVGIG